MTPLHLAADSGHGYVVIKLVNAGADIEARSEVSWWLATTCTHNNNVVISSYEIILEY